VPVSSQTFGALLIGALLGSRRGLLAQLTYLGEGLAGLPVFAGGKFGAAHLLGPTGGYLIGFAVASFVVGLLAERGFDQHFKRAVLAMTLGDVAVFIVGIAWLSRFVPGAGLLEAGLWPFLPGEIFKIFLAAALLPIGWKALRRL
jgi:biotin transporter BioY